MPPDRDADSPREPSRARVVAWLRRHGRTSRAELVAGTGLSRGTVSGLIGDLLATGEVVVAPELRSADRDRALGSAASLRAGGRPPELLTLDPAAGMLLGVDFGHRRVMLVALNAAHEVIGWRRRTYTPQSEWADRCRVALDAVAELLLPELPPLAGCGIGVPGGIRHRGQVADGIAAAFAAAVGVPVRHDNNARLAGLAEATWGAARGMGDVAYLRLSAGVGGALVLDGRIRTGVGDLGGELGHVCVDPAGPRCRCGKRGCLEAAVRLDQVLADAGCVGLDELRNRIATGDRRAVEVLADAGRLVGQVLAAVGTALDLRQVVLAGELAGFDDLLLDPVRAVLTEQLGVGTSTGGVRVSRAELGDQAGALGGIALLLDDPAIVWAEPT